MAVDHLRFQVVELMPPTIDDGILYISLKYMTAVHRCCCGCGERVVTPISPTDWSVTFHGDTVSLHPSVGNWGLACGSHYIFRRSRVEWAPRWSQERIDAGRRADHLAKQQQFDGGVQRGISPAGGGKSTREPIARGRRMRRLTRWFSRQGRD
jgi:hypothetical protein